MKLPKIEHPIFTETLPSTGAKVRFRPFRVKEEKILLMAAETKSEESILTAVQQIVGNCVIDDLDVAALPYFDLDYLFIKIRTVSVGSTVTVAFRDLEDEKIREFSIDLSALKVTVPPKASTTIKINDSVVVKMRYPTYSSLAAVATVATDTEKALMLLCECIDTIQEGENVLDVSELRATEEGLLELVDWIENLSIGTRDDIEKFFVSLPYIEHVIRYDNEKGNKREIVLRKLTDFFTW